MRHQAISGVDERNITNGRFEGIRRWNRALACWRQLRTEAAVAAAPVYSRTPAGETGHPIRFPRACEIP